MKAVNVKALKKHQIEVIFDNGVSGTVDLSALVQKGIFQVLKDETAFQNVYIRGTAIAWSDELEIDTANIYAEIVKQEPAQIFHKPSYNAAD